MASNNYLYALLLLIFIFIVSCTTEENEPQGSFETFTTYSFRLHAEDTRASLDENSYKMRWDKEDKIDIWSGSSVDSLNKCVFTTIEGGINNAYFTYTGPSMRTRVYFGFYPSILSHSTPDCSINVPTDGSIRQNLPDDALHLKDFQAMYSNRIEREEESNELTKLQFHHLTSLIILKIHNERSEPVTCRSVSLKMTDESTIFTSSAVYKAGSDKLSATLVPNRTSSTGLRLGDTGFEISSGGMIKCFLPLLPSADFAHTTLTFTLKTDVKEYAMTFPEDVSKAIGSFKQSTYYVFNLRLAENRIELINSGITPWEEGPMGEVTLHPSAS